MNKKQTWWLFGAAVALLGFILFVERNLSVSGETATVDRRLAPGFDTNAVAAIEIRSPDRPTIRLNRGDAGWEVVEPLRYPADALLAGFWLDLFAKAEWRVHLTPEDLQREDRAVAEFGLQPPHVTVLMEHGENRTELRFGDRAQVGDQMFVQIADQGGVFIVDGDLLDLLPMEVAQWRNRAMVNLAGVNFDRIESRHQGRGYTLAPEVGADGGVRWRLTRPIEARADPEIVQLLLWRVAGWRVEEFVNDDPQAELEPYGLADPVSVLAVGRGTNDLMTVEIGKAPEDRPDMVYARLVEHGNVVLTSRPTAEILKEPYGHWRDRRVIRLEPEQIRTIIAGGAANYRLEQREADGWQIIEPEELPADEEWVDSFLQHLNSMEIVNFEKDIVTDFTPYGLAAPARQFTLQTSAVVPTNTFEIPRLSFGTNAEAAPFVRRSDESAVYGISNEGFNSLPVTHWQWRERQIWNFTTNQVRKVTITQGGATREIVRSDDGAWSLAPGSQGLLEPDVEEAVFRMGQLRANWWAARGEESREPFGFTDESLKITFDLVVDGRSQRRSVEIGGFRDGYSPYGGVQLDDGEFWIFDFPLPLFYEHVKRVFALGPFPGHLQ